MTAVTGLVQGLASILPIPGMQQLMGVVRAFLRLAVGLVDEVILAYATLDYQASFVIQAHIH